MLIVKPFMKKNIGCLGQRPVTMGVHFHYATAGKTSGLCQSHERFWNELAGLIRAFDVRILGGDWNKSLMKVVPELRSRGIGIETVSWYPWCCEQGSAHADSMALFVVNTILVKKLYAPLSATRHSWPAEHSWPGTCGPGMAVKSYLPYGQTASLSEKMQMFLESNAEYAARERAGESSGSTVVDAFAYAQETPQCLRVKEKRLLHQLWSINGVFYKGSHFPLCFWTDNPGLRSQQKFYERKGRRRQRARAARETRGARGAREAVTSRARSWSPGGGASVCSEPAYVELPTNASRVTQSRGEQGISAMTQARHYWSPEEYRRWNRQWNENDSWSMSSSWYAGTQRGWQGSRSSGDHWTRW